VTSQTKRRILFVDDDAQSWSSTLEPVLCEAGWEWRSSESVRHAIQLLRKEDFGLVLLDLGFPGERLTGPQAVLEVRKRAPDVPIIVFTGTAPSDLQTAVECVRAGAWDYLSKTDLDLTRLIREADKAVQMADARRCRRRLLESIYRSEAAPCFVPFEDDADHWPCINLFACRLLGLIPIGGLSASEMIARQQEWANRIVQVIGDPSAQRAVELRYTITPREDAESALGVWLIGRGFGRTAQEAWDAAQELWIDLRSFLHLGEDICQFTPVTDTECLKALLQPFSARWAAEFIRGPRFVIKERRSAFGFQPTSSDDTERKSLALPLPFDAAAPGVLKDFCALAAGQKQPITFSISLRPYSRRQFAQDALEQSVDVVADELRAGKLEQDDENSVSDEPEFAARVALASANMALRQSCEVGVVVASDQAVSSVFLKVISDEFTGGNSGLWDMRNLSYEERDRCLRNWGWLSPQHAREGVFLTLYQIRDAALLLRLPSPETTKREVPAPADLPPGGDILVGTNRYQDHQREIFLSRDDRRRHLYAIGQTGTGKSTLLLNMILQDIRNGEGVGVVDPHGDLIEAILPHIPPCRSDDVILFDPADTERPLGLNMLETSDPGQRDLVVNELVDIISKLAVRMNPESVGPMFEHYLRNALLALVEYSDATLLDVPRMFVDKDFRKRVVAKVRNPVVPLFWNNEFEQSQRGQLSADMLSYVISKFGRFIGNNVVRNIIAQPRSSFDFRQVMDEGKILLANLSKGRLGDINSDLLGFILVGKFQIAAFNRADTPEEQRRDFYLYLDEFQNFTTDSIPTVLAEARKYRLNLHLAHQFVGQLSQRVRDAVIGNVGTILAFRVGVDDAEVIGRPFAPVFEGVNFLSLENFRACARLLVQNEPKRPFTLHAPPPPTGGSKKIAEEIRKKSRKKYGRPRKDVEAHVHRRMTSDQSEVSGSRSGDYLSESLFDVK